METAVVALFSASTHKPQLSAWMELVFDKHQSKTRYIKLCQATKLLYPVVVKTINVKSPGSTDWRYFLPAKSLKPFNFCTDDLQPFLHSTVPIHGAQKAKQLSTVPGCGTCLAGAWPALGWRARWPVCCDSRRGRGCSSSPPGDRGSGCGLRDEPARTRSQCGLGPTASDAPAAGKSRESDLGRRQKVILLGRVLLLAYIQYLTAALISSSGKRKFFKNFPWINSYTFLGPSSSAPHLQNAGAVIHFKMSQVTCTDT